MAFADEVRAVLADTLNLPPEFTAMIPQLVAQSPVNNAPAKGDLLTWETHNASPTATGTTFATGTDLFSTTLEFTAQGNNSYSFLFAAAGWALNTTGASLNLHLNFDGVDDGVMGQTSVNTTNAVHPCTFITPFTTTNGTHSVNARLVVGAGTGTVFGASADGYTPIFGALYRI